MRGYYGIGIENTKNILNVGTLWRSAYSFGAKFIFTIGRRYKTQASDTCKAWKSIPLFQYDSFPEFYKSIPRDCQLIGIEIDPAATKIENLCHPERCVYLLGAEDHGLSKTAINKCHSLVQLPGTFCLNVSVAGSIVMYDRICKGAV